MNNNGKKVYNSNNRGTNFDYRRKLNDDKAKKEKELETRRIEDYAELLMVADALEARVIEVKAIKDDAAKSNKHLDRDETKIWIGNISDYFKTYKKEYSTSSRISVLVNIMIDIAKSQINTKLLPYHDAIRMLYFGERFQAYFSTAYDGKRDNLIDSHKALFNCGDLENAIFEDLTTSTYTVVEIKHVGIKSIEHGEDPQEEADAMEVTPAVDNNDSVAISEKDKNDSVAKSILPNDVDPATKEAVTIEPVTSTQGLTTDDIVVSSTVES